VPEPVDPQEAAFAGLGAIAIHALRVANLQFGESVIVVGLGILGNLVSQIAHAAAYRTAALDINPERGKKLRELGLPHVYSTPEELEKHLAEAAGQAGADAVVLCASGPGEALINRAMSWLRDRGKIAFHVDEPFKAGDTIVLRLAGGQPSETPLTIRIDETTYQINVLGGMWRSYHLPVPDHLIGQQYLAIDLQAPAFVPAYIDPNSDDLRVLSVRVSDIRID